MTNFHAELMNLGILSVLFTEPGERRLEDGTFFSDPRLTTLSRLTDTVGESFDDLNLSRFLQTTSKDEFLERLRDVKFNFLSNRDLYLVPSYLHNLNLKMYRINYKMAPLVLVYGLKFQDVCRILLRTEKGGLFPTLFACAFVGTSDERRRFFLVVEGLKGGEKIES